MRENVKFDSDLLEKVRSASQKKGQMISGYIEVAVQQALSPRYWVHDNSDAFEKYLDEKKIKYEARDHGFVLIDLPDPVAFGIEWGIYKALHSPHYKDQRTA